MWTSWKSRWANSSPAARRMLSRFVSLFLRPAMGKSGRPRSELSKSELTGQFRNGRSPSAQGRSGGAQQRARGRRPAAIHPDPVVRMRPDQALENGVEAQAVLDHVGIAVSRPRDRDLGRKDGPVAMRVAFAHEHPGK